MFYIILCPSSMCYRQSVLDKHLMALVVWNLIIEDVLQFTLYETEGMVCSFRYNRSLTHQPSVLGRLLLFGRSVMIDSLRPHGLQHARLPILHHLPELAQVHVHWVNDAIQPSYPLSSPSPPAFNLSRHQGLFYVSLLLVGQVSLLYRWTDECELLFTHNTSDIEYVGFSPALTNSPVLCRHQLGILPFNSVLTLNQFWRRGLVQVPQVKGSVPHDSLCFRH